jgi:hypothetical protein
MYNSDNLRFIQVGLVVFFNVLSYNYREEDPIWIIYADAKFIFSKVVRKNPASEFRKEIGGIEEFYEQLIKKELLTYR